MEVDGEYGILVARHNCRMIRPADPQSLFRVVQDELEAGRLILPTLPEVATRIGQIVSREDADAAAVAAQIAKDPAMASRMIWVANSAALRGAGPAVGSLQQAVTRLGFDLTRVLVNQMVLEQLFSARTPVLRKIMRETWARSLVVAALAQALAERAALSPETGLLAGLTHRVGMLPIVKLLDQHPAMVADEAATHRVLGQLHARVAILLLKSWNFPPELLDVPRLAFDYTRQHDGPADYADVVSVATLLTAAPSELELPEGQDPRKAPSLAKLGVNLGADAVETAGLLGAYERNLKILRG